ncbi:MAG: lmo0937 family membrane protein [Chitinophagaceae bacterium]|nr:MAG: lmo0937 family membrane protein [Chitinophagaceae bacterium]
MGNLLYILVVILIIGWLLGVFAFHVAGGLIHALLVIAVILLIVKLVSGRRI